MEPEEPDQNAIKEDDEAEIEFPAGTPVPPLDSMLNLFNWYCRYFCRGAIEDCRGLRVQFREEDFVHLIKLIDRYGKEPKNRSEAIRQIKAGELKFFHGTKRFPPNFSLRRARDLACAMIVVRDPTIIVTNWQPLGSANPGEAYIRNFGKDKRRRYRVLICGIAGKKRNPVTMFPRQRFANDEISIILWP
jgi:hypothetical protein